MIVHEPMDNVRSTNQLIYYSSPKTSEDAHEFIMALQEYLLDELKNSEKNQGHTHHGEIYDTDLYLSMKAFWDLFTGEITHEYTCTSCKSTFQHKEPINYLLLKFSDVHHENNQDCTVEFLIDYYLQEETIENYQCRFCKQKSSATKNSAITTYPSFMCILLCRSRRDNNGTISSAVQFPALGFGIKGGNMPYDLSATVHHTPKRNGSGHYTAIARSRDLQSHEWFMYDDDRVFLSKFTNMQKKHAMVLKCHMKTAAILFYVSPSLETRIKNAKTIDLMEVEKEKEKFVPVGDIDADGEEGDADGYGGNSNSHDKHKDDNNDDKEEKAESSEKDSSTAATVHPPTTTTTPATAPPATTRRKKKEKGKKAQKAKNALRKRKKAAKEQSTKKTVRSFCSSSSSSSSSLSSGEEHDMKSSGSSDSSSGTGSSGSSDSLSGTGSSDSS